MIETLEQIRKGCEGNAGLISYASGVDVKISLLKSKSHNLYYIVRYVKIDDIWLSYYDDYDIEDKKNAEETFDRICEKYNAKIDNNPNIKKIELPLGEYFTLELDDKGGGTVSSSLTKNVEIMGKLYLGAMHGLESIVLAHACAGVNVEDKKYLEGIKTAIEAIYNNLGESW